MKLIKSLASNHSKSNTIKPERTPNQINLTIQISPNQTMEMGSITTIKVSIKTIKTPLNPVNTGDTPEMMVGRIKGIEKK
jgi:hypothetical protein